MTYNFLGLRGTETGEIVPESASRELGDFEACVKVTHSGVCGTDEHYLKSGITLGHEGIGFVTAVGPRVSLVKVGDRVGFGWNHFFCGKCEPCLVGHDIYCHNKREYGADDKDIGSFSSGVTWDEKSLYVIPEGIPSAEAAPLMCGGVTVWSVLASYGIKPYERVGIVGVGGLGHLAIQFAAKMGCEVVVFSGTESKREESLAFGATEFHATSGLKDLSHIKKVKHLLMTANAQPDYSLFSSVVDFMGAIYVLTVSFGTTPVPMLTLLANGIKIQGSSGASRSEIIKMLDFAARHKVFPKIMTYPLTKGGATEAMSTLRQGKMRYRGVLVMEK
ncbi:NADP-dependent alcohol dehydrogenase C 2 [Limtongia smithiae]|uniref:NADP-dependent alcohol dehydrogenase C 2 n=1 Tax=Limtongia smithiae TaxID=1125753 RepID=UPI0034CEA049